MKRADIMDELQLNHRETFMNNYLKPAMEEGYVEMTNPEKLTSSKKRYKLTAKGRDFKRIVICKKWEANCNKKLIVADL